LNKEIYFIRASNDRFGGAEKYLSRLSKGLKEINIPHKVINSKLPKFLPSWLRVILFNLQVSLFKENKNGKKVLFGGYPKGCDKKMIVWEKVAEKEPHIVWQYTRNNTLKKENFDMTDAYTCVRGFMLKNKLW